MGRGRQSLTHNQPATGLRRVGDSPFEALSGQTGEIVGREIIHYAAAGSTMDEAAALAARGAPEGLVVLADAQAAGRGRHGRAWVSRPGDDLLFSVVLYPRPGFVHQLLMLAALAAAGAAEDVTGQRPTLKWPNDVRAGGRKLCGVIAESRSGPGGPIATRPAEAPVTASRLAAVIGAGMNVNLDPSRPDAPPGATSLREIAGRPVSRVDAFRAALARMDRLYLRLVRGESLVAEWSSRLETVGQNVTVAIGDPRRPDRVISGMAEGVDDMGRLLVRDPAGRLWPLAAGEVTLQSSS
jgi:BirA family biotin operon repressor/biotin-[acetyl-CoA-carboxylase] ligase